MKRKSQVISAALKAEIMEAAKAPGCIVSEVAKNYNISPNLLYAWRSENNKLHKQKIQIHSNNENNFVELSMDKSMTQKIPPTLSLKKALLEFDNFSLELEGNVSSKKLVRLITILEEPC